MQSRKVEEEEEEKIIRFNFNSYQKVNKKRVWRGRAVKYVKFLKHVIKQTGLSATIL
jgi:hypothetical protein